LQETARNQNALPWLDLQGVSCG